MFLEGLPERAEPLPKAGEYFRKVFSSRLRQKLGRAAKAAPKVNLRAVKIGAGFLARNVLAFTPLKPIFRAEP
jgi:hypothetical protein